MDYLTKLKEQHQTSVKITCPIKGIEICFVYYPGLILAVSSTGLLGFNVAREWHSHTQHLGSKTARMHKTLLNELVHITRWYDGKADMNKALRELINY